MHVQLNARCSVLAAANPIYGEYVTNLSPSQNIGIQETLLTRFDLIFVVLDLNEEQHDRNVAKKVSSNHRFQTTGQGAQSNKMTTGKIEMEIVHDDEDEGLEIFEQYNQLLHEGKNV